MVRVVAHQDDQFASAALKKLGQRGYPVRTAGNDETAKPNEIALFSLNGESRMVFTGKHMRLAAHRLIQAGVVPDWALPTPYLVAIREHPNPKIRTGLDEALRWFTAAYDMWFSGKGKSACPWGAEPKGDEACRLFQEWKNRSDQVCAVNGNQLIARFFSQLEPISSAALQEAMCRVNGGLRRAVSAFCLHANEERTGIVEAINPEIVRGVAGFIEQLPIDRLDVYTFHPGDWDVLVQYGLQDTVLKTIWNRPDELRKHWQLSETISHASGKVKLHPLSELISDDRLAKQLLWEARQRARKMAEQIRKNPPPIFRMLTPKEQERRLASEAALYLLMTEACADSVYIGFEVHAEYWRSGQLFQGGGKLLPVLFAPACLRQHWADWAVTESRSAEVAALSRAA